MDLVKDDDVVAIQLAPPDLGLPQVPSCHWWRTREQKPLTLTIPHDRVMLFGEGREKGRSVRAGQQD